MVKIKKNVEMTLPELIEWAWKNDVNSRRFISSHNTSVTFSEYGNFFTSVKHIFKDETFTVEIEEEITEETKINKLVEVYRNIEDTILFTDLHHDYSISEVKDNEEYAVCSRAFYILNDDFNMTLIWKDGELVGDE